MPKKMHIGYDLSWTHLEGRWSIPGSWSHKVFPDIGMYKEMALLAERGLLDFIFFGDGSGIPSTWKGTRDDAVKWAVGWPRQDMSPYIAIMSEITKHIGFGLTYSSTFMHPFYVARLLNSLDHVTNGRIAFNVIASSRQADAANYGFDELMEHSRRYDRMEEFMDVCKALWNSVEPDALIWDRDTGIAADPAKVHAVDHKGEYFSVAGPLSCVPSPQIEPVIVQAGASPRGIRASAHFVDHVFAASPGLAKQIQHRKALDDALLAEGRDPSKVGILWDVVLLVEENSTEVKRRKEQLLSVIPEEAIGAFTSHQYGYDLSNLPDSFTIHEINQDIIDRNASPVGFMNMTSHLDPDKTITRAEFYDELRQHSLSHKDMNAGSAQEVADYMEEVFVETGERGGFMIAHPPKSPRDLLNVIDYLVPELQRRGRFRTAYTGKNLRENLGDD
jgi:FMN-dependent oxidoreductase (nitrilotriacetate monooxygenase family)